MKFKKKTLKRLGKLLGMFLLFELSGYLQLIPVALLKINKITPQLEVLLGCFSNLILLMILFFMYRIDLRREWKNFTKNLNYSMDSCFKYWCIGLAGMLVANIIIGSFLNLGQAENEELVQGMIVALPSVMLLNAGIVAPIIEELIFRKAFRDAIKGKWPFILISGLVFGLMHVLVATTWAEVLFFIPYASLGCAFAYMYYDTDSVFAPMLAHLFHNTVLIIFSII